MCPTHEDFEIFKKNIKIYQVFRQNNTFSHIIKQMLNISRREENLGVVFENGIALITK